MFDLIPLTFTDIGPDRIEVEAQVDAPTPDAFAPGGLELIGPGQPVAPKPGAEAGRGARVPDGG